MPERLQRTCEPPGLDPVRGIEVVTLLEHFELEVGENARKAGSDLLVLVRVAETAERVVHGLRKASECVTVELVGLERLRDLTKAGRALRHPRRRLAGRTWGWLDAFSKLGLHESGHVPVVREALEPLVFLPQRRLGRTQIPVPRPRGLEGQTLQSIGVTRSKREC